MITDPKLADAYFDVEFFFAGGIAAKRHVLTKGDIITKHTHEYDHLSVLGYGSVRVTTPQTSRVYDAGECVVIEKNIEHQIVALEDSVWLCIHKELE